LEKGKEPATKDADEEPFFDDTKSAVNLLRSAFRKIEDVGAAFDIKVHHDEYKDPSVKGLAFRIHRLAKNLENLPVVKRAARCHFVFDNGSDDGDDSSHDSDDGSDSSHGGDDSGTPTVATDKMIDSCLVNLLRLCVCLFVLVRLLNCLVCF
jgi:hypothetical protein